MMNRTPLSNSTTDLHDQIGAVLELIRPAIQNDGGDIELLSVTNNGVVRIRFHGACIGCPSSNMTLKLVIEENLRHHVPGFTEVIAVSGRE